MAMTTEPRFKHAKGFFRCNADVPTGKFSDDEAETALTRKCRTDLTPFINALPWDGRITKYECPTCGAPQIVERPAPYDDEE